MDEKGDPVTNLTRDDFLVYEEGVPQEIAIFGSDRDRPASIGIVFDTSGSMVDKIEEVRDAVFHFVETINPEDDIFIMRFGTGIAVVQDFTADRKKLRQTVERLIPAQGPTPLYDAIVEGLKYIRRGRHRKKALVVITDGNDTNSEIDPQEAVDFAIRSEVPVYSIGIGHGERGSFGHPGRAFFHQDTFFKDTVDVEALRAFSNLTGGKTFVLERAHRKNGVDQIDQACQQIATELRHQYSLGYYSNSPGKSRSYRRVRVKVRKAKLRVRARDGYFAPRLALPH